MSKIGDQQGSASQSPQNGSKILEQKVSALPVDVGLL